MARQMVSAAAMLMVMTALPVAAAAGCEQREIDQLSKQALEAYAGRRYALAAKLFEAGAARAQLCGQPARQARFLNGAGGSEFATYRYREAIRLFQEAGKVADSTNDAEVIAVVALNLSSLYMALWEPAAAEESLRRAALRLPKGSIHRSKLMAQQMMLSSLRGDPVRAQAVGHEAALEASRAGDAAIETLTWDKLGRLALENGRLDEAEELLTAAFRVRKLQKLATVESSYRSLARLRLAQGRNREALILARAADVARQKAPTMNAEWAARYSTAMALEGAGEHVEALKEYEAALESSEAWRSGLLPAQWMLMAAEVNESAIAKRYAFLAVSQGESEKALLAVLRSRASALRALAANAAWRQRRLPLEFGDVLAMLRDAELRRLKGDARAGAAAEQFRGKLAALEAGSGAAAWAVRQLASVKSVQDAMRAEDAHYTYLMGEDHSLAWVITQKEIKLEKLPGRAEIERKIQAYRAALQTDDAKAGALGSELYALLLGWGGKAVQAAEHWSLSLDGGLYSLPFGALKEGDSYLAERHRLSGAPVPETSVSDAKQAPKPGLLAVGDCVYNRADPRRTGTERERSVWDVLPRLNAGTRPAWELPRLAGSAAEIRQVSTEYRRQGSQVRVLSGAEADVWGVREALRSAPGVVHMAVHVLRGAAGGSAVEVARFDEGRGTTRRPEEAFLALSLDENGQPGVLSASTIAAQLHAPGALVVMSGCSSGQGEVLSGAGLQGLTHAWLAAGARGVVGTLWPVPDDSGEVFRDFYRKLAEGHSPSAALQGAQIAAIRAGGWRSHPRHWAAYILMERDSR